MARKITIDRMPAGPNAPATWERYRVSWTSKDGNRVSTYQKTKAEAIEVAQVQVATFAAQGIIAEIEDCTGENDAA